MANKFPALFLSHGSPMLATSHEEYARKLQKLGRDLPRPQAIVVISAHWYTHGSFVLGSEQPEQIYDFGGFPPELYQYQYKPSGSPQLAHLIARTLCPIPVQETLEWGLDHGSWTLLTHLYPEADIPVIQLSIDRHLTARQYMDMGRRLRFLRDQDVLVLGSGNIVHNLAKIKWDDNAPDYDWALRFDSRFQQLIEDKDYNELCDYKNWGEYSRLAAPSPEHLDPLFYFLGMLDEGESPQLFYEGIQHGSVSMTSYTSSF